MTWKLKQERMGSSLLSELVSRNLTTDQQKCYILKGTISYPFANKVLLDLLLIDLFTRTKNTKQKLSSTISTPENNCSIPIFDLKDRPYHLAVRCQSPLPTRSDAPLASPSVLHTRRRYHGLFHSWGRA